MIRILRVGITIVVMCPALAWSQCNVPDSADYQVDFTATWSAETLPQQFPANAHFSGLVGGSHNAQVSFWEGGELASNGIEEMAETGSKTTLLVEVNDAIDAGTALNVVSGGGIGDSPGFASTTFTLDQAHSLATVVAMIAPSPDWFVGVHGMNLLSGGNWLADVTVDLFGYDAGTDSGTTYASADSDTQPPQAISALAGAMFMQQGELVPFGTFRFLRLTESCLDTDGDGDPDDIDPDDDNDGISDALDTQPLVASNLCTSRDGDNATLAGPIVGDLTCAAKGIIDVQGTTQVMGSAPAHLRLIAPFIGIQSGAGVLQGGLLTAISADPLPSCDPVNPAPTCGNDIHCQFPSDPSQPAFCGQVAGTGGQGGTCGSDSDCQPGFACVPIMEGQEVCLALCSGANGPFGGQHPDCAISEQCLSTGFVSGGVEYGFCVE